MLRVQTSESFSLWFVTSESASSMSVIDAQNQSGASVSLSSSTLASVGNGVYRFDSSQFSPVLAGPVQVLLTAEDNLGNKISKSVFVGGYVDNINASIASRATPTDVQSSMTAQGYTTARAAFLDNLDAAISGVATAVWTVASGARVLGHLVGRHVVVRGTPWREDVYGADNGMLLDTYELKDFDGALITDAGGNNPLDSPGVRIADRDEP